MLLAIEMDRYGDPVVLHPVERRAYEPGPDEVVVRVAVAGVNRADLFIRSGYSSESLDRAGLQAAMDAIAEAVAGGALHVAELHRFPLRDAAHAHTEMEAGRLGGGGSSWSRDEASFKLVSNQFQTSFKLVSN